MERLFELHRHRDKSFGHDPHTNIRVGDTVLWGYVPKEYDVLAVNPNRSHRSAEIRLKAYPNGVSFVLKLADLVSAQNVERERKPTVFPPRKAA